MEVATQALGLNDSVLVHTAYCRAVHREKEKPEEPLK